MNKNIKSLWFRLRLSRNDVAMAMAERYYNHYYWASNDYRDYAALRSFVAPVPTDNKRPGFDCSHWNGPVNMDTAAANGFEFVFIKAADGTVQTKYFDVNYPAAKDKLYRAPYFWLYPGDRVSLSLQAKKWWDIIVKYGLPDLPPVIDYEWTYWGGQPANPTNGDLEGVINAFLEVSGGLKPVIYTSVGYVGTVGAIPERIIDKTRGVWCAHYGVDVPKIPAMYNAYLFHQWTDQMDGKLVGYDPLIAKAADGNYFNGTKQDLDLLAGNSTPVPEPVKTWKGTVRPNRRIGVFPNPIISAKVRGTRRAGSSEVGVLVENVPDNWLFLKFGPRKYLPVRTLDGTVNHVELEEVNPNEPGCSPAADIPVLQVAAGNKSGGDLPVMSLPSGLSEQIDKIGAGEWFLVHDHYIPDPEGFGSAQKRWYPRVDGGFVEKDKITSIPERTVAAEFYSDGQNTLRFSNDTCLVVPDHNEIERYTVPSDGYKYKRAAHDWERPDWSYYPRTRSAVPETVPLWDKPDFYDLREDWQNLWNKLIKWASHGAMTGGQLKTAWADITAERKALTDNHGLTHGFTDYILGLFLENNKPMKQKGLVFGGTMMRMRFGSTIHALDPSNPAPELPWLLDRPWLWGWATQISSESVSFKFPNLKPWGGFGVPYLILGYEEKNTLKPEHLVNLEAGQVYSPYARV